MCFKGDNSMLSVHTVLILYQTFFAGTMVLEKAKLRKSVILLVK